MDYVWLPEGKIRTPTPKARGVLHARIETTHPAVPETSPVSQGNAPWPPQVRLGVNLGKYRGNMTTLAPTVAIFYLWIVGASLWNSWIFNAFDFLYTSSGYLTWPWKDPPFFE